MVDRKEVIQDDELLGEGVSMIAPPNPLRGLTGGDGQYLKGVIGEIDGPVLLVGHSYGGAVITAAGTADNVVVVMTAVRACAAQPA